MSSAGRDEVLRDGCDRPEGRPAEPRASLTRTPPMRELGGLTRPLGAAEDMNEDKGAGEAAALGAAPTGGPGGLPERVVVEWDGDLRFRGGREGGPSIVLDGRKRAGPGAVDAVAIAVAACSSQDVVEILAKRRTPAEALSVEVRYSRVDGTPRRLETIHLVFRVRTASERPHVERAVALAVEKYCSVASSLASDVRITTEVELEAP
jgi:putative redox protein